MGIAENRSRKNAPLGAFWSVEFAKPTHVWRESLSRQAELGDLLQLFQPRRYCTVTRRIEMDIIKVATNSRSTSVAGAIAGVVRDNGRAEVQAIGAGAVNQSVKAAAIARGYLALDGIDVVVVPAFTEVSIDGQERTAIRLVVEPR
jgi:stage V sporulation protein S